MMIASGTEMSSITAGLNTPASSSGSPGTSQAMTSTAGSTVSRANAPPAGGSCRLRVRAPRHGPGPAPAGAVPAGAGQPHG